MAGLEERRVGLFPAPPDGGGVELRPEVGCCDRPRAALGCGLEPEPGKKQSVGVEFPLSWFGPTSGSADCSSYEGKVGFCCAFESYSYGSVAPLNGPHSCDCEWRRPFSPLGPRASWCCNSWELIGEAGYNDAYLAGGLDAVPGVGGNFTPCHDCTVMEGFLIGLTGVTVRVYYGCRGVSASCQLALSIGAHLDGWCKTLWDNEVSTKHPCGRYRMGSVGVEYNSLFSPIEAGDPPGEDRLIEEVGCAPVLGCGWWAGSGRTPAIGGPHETSFGGDPGLRLNFGSATVTIGDSGSTGGGSGSGGGGASYRVSPSSVSYSPALPSAPCGGCGGRRGLTAAQRARIRAAMGG